MIVERSVRNTDRIARGGEGRRDVTPPAFGAEGAGEPIERLAGTRVRAEGPHVRKALPVALACTAFALMAAPTGAEAGARAGPHVRFDAPVKVTPTGAGGYEPAVYVDKFGNIFVTAHKENWQLALGPDANSPTGTRSMSYTWWSTNDGTSFTDIPGLTPLSLENHDFGDEGDFALDGADHLYFVDTNVADVTFTRWTITGRGQISFDTHRPVLPAGEPVDDRPWITAHENGHAFYFGNEGDSDTYPFGQG